MKKHISTSISTSTLITGLLALTLIFSLGFTAHASEPTEDSHTLPCTTHTWGDPEPWKPAPELYPMIWMVYCQETSCNAETRREHLVPNCDNGHEWGPWVVITPLTDTTLGLERRTCSTCGEIEERPLVGQIHFGLIGHYFHNGRMLSTSFYWMTLSPGDMVNWDDVDAAYEDWVSRGGLWPDTTTAWRTAGSVSLTFDYREEIGHYHFTEGRLEPSYSMFFMSPATPIMLTGAVNG